MGEQWHCAKGGENRGPVTPAQLKELAVKGEIAPDDLIWCEGKIPDWVPAKTAKGLFTATSPPPLPPSFRPPVAGNVGAEDEDAEKTEDTPTAKGEALGATCAVVGAIFLIFFLLVRSYS